VDFGAFVEILPGTDGLLHVSEMAHHRVQDVRTEVKEGDQVLVKVVSIDPSGKIRLSRKALLDEAQGGGSTDGGPRTGGGGEGGRPEGGGGRPEGGSGPRPERHRGGEHRGGERRAAGEHGRRDHGRDRPRHQR
jgi:polyribonucleotide nucleotidyltransferase